jgi:hypothetical protein
MTFEPMHDITRNPCYVELLTPERFIEMYRNDRDNIEWARPVPAPLGSRVLGHILVRRKHPIYPPLEKRLF